MEPSRKNLQNIKDLGREAAQLVSSLAPEEGQATLVTLSGELGAGKTAFVQAMAAALGVTDHVTSPTFVLAKRYELTGMPFARLIHIDGYRLKGGEDLRSISLNELMLDSGNLIALEWPEIVADGLPAADVAIRLEVLSDGSRALTYV